MHQPPNTNQHNPKNFPDAHDILMNAPFGVFTFTPDGKLLSANPAMVRMLGYDSSQELIERITDITSRLYVDPADRTELTRILAQYGGVQDHDFRLQQNNGAEQWVSVSIVEQKDETGNVYYQGFLKDISMRMQAEAESIKSHASLISVLNSIEDLIYVADMFSYEVLFVNDYGKNLFGNFAGEKCWSIFQADQTRPCVFCTNHRLLDAQGKPSGTYVWQHHNQNLDKWFYCQDKAIPWPDGRLVRLEIATDITELKKKEQELSIKDMAINSSNDAIAIADMDGRLNFVNKAFLDLWGYTEAEDVLGRYAASLHVNTEEAQKMLKKVQTEGSISMQEASIRKADGTEIDVQVNSSLILRQDGLQAGSIGVFRDLTEIKRAQANLDAAYKSLQKTLHEKDMFFSIIAHDLKSPMAGFLDLTRFFSEELDTFSSQEIRQLSQEMHKSLENIFDLLNNLLMWSRTQQGQIKHQPELQKLDSLIQQHKEMARQVGIKKTIEVYSEVPDDLMVWADQQMISTVLRNLLFNAIKFTRPGGKVCARASRYNSFVKVEIRDNGIGMDEKMTSKVFALDQKTSRKGTAGEKGTGLGLILCKDFVQRNGGEIWIESQPEQGTSVYFTLPTGEDRKS